VTSLFLFLQSVITVREKDISVFAFLRFIFDVSKSSFGGGGAMRLEHWVKYFFFFFLWERLVEPSVRQMLCGV